MKSSLPLSTSSSLPSSTSSSSSTTTSSSSYIDIVKIEFITSSLVCMSNGIHDIKLCYTIFKKTCDILGLKIKDNLEMFSIKFLSSMNQKNDLKLNTNADYYLNDLIRLQKVWESYFPSLHIYFVEGLKLVEKKINLDNGLVSWPITDSYFIWLWLHVIAIDMDLNFGLEEKSAFLIFITDIINCSKCKQHYLGHRDEMIKSLMKTTCANTLLALHTFINENKFKKNQPKFYFDEKLILSFYYRKYQNNYLILKTSYEL